MIAAPRIVEGNNINNNTREGWFTGFLLNYIYSMTKQNIIFYHFSRTALRYHPRRSVGSLCKSTLLLSFARSFGWIKLSMIERYRDYDQRIVIVTFTYFSLRFTYLIIQFVDPASSNMFEQTLQSSFLRNASARSILIRSPKRNFMNFHPFSFFLLFHFAITNKEI